MLNNIILLYKCSGHSARGSAAYACIERDSGQLLALTEWNIRWRIAAKGTQKLASREEDDRQAAKFPPQVNVILSLLISKKMISV